MLGMKQQLKLAGHLIAIGKGIDVFEENMKKWAEGDVDPYGNPLEPQDKPIELNENGESKELAAARQRAEGTLNAEKRHEGWEKYVEQAKEFYQFDDTQAATAESVLREMIDRSDSIRADEEWRERAYRNRLWSFMGSRLGLRRHNVIEDIVSDDFTVLTRPIQDLYMELRVRIDSIPTEAQRRAAEERILASMSEQGFDLDDERQGGME